MSAHSSAAYADPGFLIFRRDASLMAQRFDPKRLTLSGEPFRIVSEVGINPVTLQTLFSVSSDGTLAYITAGSAKTRLLWLSRSGREIATAAPPGYYNSLDLSPDGTRVAYDLASEMGSLDIFLMDLERNAPSRFTFEGTTSFFPIWSPDGSRIVYSSLRGAPPNLYQKVTSGAGPEEPVLPSPRPQMPTSWSADGRFLVVAVLDPRTKWDIWVLPMTGDRKPFPFAEAAFDERTGVISPDGRWLAYASNESGNFEIYVRPFPAGPGRWQVSRDGGTEAALAARRPRALLPVGGSADRRGGGPTRSGRVPDGRRDAALRRTPGGDREPEQLEPVRGHRGRAALPRQHGRTAGRVDPDHGGSRLAGRAPEVNASTRRGAP